MAVNAQEIGDNHAVYLGDCCESIPGLPKASVHLSIYSPPFRGLYIYSSSPRDFSNSDTPEKFWEHYDFLLNELTRVTLPGRISCVHCMDIPSGNTGNDYVLDFPGEIVRLYEKHGWRYLGRHSIWKEPLAVRNRTLMKTLFHTTIVEDSSKALLAHADFLLLFRRKGENKIPIAHPNGLLSYAGEREVPKELIRFRGYEGQQIYNRYSHWIWRQYASSQWDDIRIWKTLPGTKEEGDEQVPHPLQLDVIERCLILRSNPGEVVLTPFMGVGSEVCAAVVNGRKAVGVELKQGYYNQALKNIAHYSKHGFAELSQDQELQLEEPEAVPQESMF